MEVFYVSLDSVVNFVLYITFEVEVHELAVHVEFSCGQKNVASLEYWPLSVYEHLSICFTVLALKSRAASA